MKKNGVTVSERTVAMNPIAPKFKGLVKLHKEARHMRPLVCYKIAKIAVKFLKENFRFETRHNIKNNLELIEDLNKLKIKSNDKLISFGRF